MIFNKNREEDINDPHYIENMSLKKAIWVILLSISALFVDPYVRHVVYYNDDNKVYI